MKKQTLNEQYDYKSSEDVSRYYNSLLLQLDYENRKYLNNTTIQELELWHTQFLNRYVKFQKEFNNDFVKYIQDKTK